MASGRMLGRPGRGRARPRSPSSGRRSGTACSGTPIPSGETIRIKKVPFTVVGVLEPKGQSAFGQDQDDLILIPLSTAKKKVLGTNRSNPRSVGQISVRVRDAGLMAEAEEPDPGHPPAAPPAAGRPGGRLPGARPRRDVRGPGGVGPRHDHAPGGHRLRLPHGRRDRHHEHHAGVGDRANPRDRPPHGRRGARAGHPRPVPGGGGDAVGGRRPDRASAIGVLASVVIANLAEWSTDVSLQAVAMAFAVRGRWWACSSASTPRGRRRGSIRSRPSATSEPWGLSSIR